MISLGNIVAFSVWPCVGRVGKKWGSWQSVTSSDSSGLITAEAVVWPPGLVVVEVAAEL